VERGFGRGRDGIDNSDCFVFAVRQAHPLLDHGARRQQRINLRRLLLSQSGAIEEPKAKRDGE
jgi:hypothetical protein